MMTSHSTEPEPEIFGSAFWKSFLPCFIAQEFKGALKEDTVDYAAYTANVKRKRPTPRKAKSGRIPVDDEDYDDDDDDWTGGSRRLGSGRRGNSSRGRPRQ